MIVVALKCAEKNPSASTTLQKRPDPSLYITKAQVEAPDSCTNTHTHTVGLLLSPLWLTQLGFKSFIFTLIYYKTAVCNPRSPSTLPRRIVSSVRPPARPFKCCGSSVTLLLSWTPCLSLSLSHHSEREAAATEVTPEVRRLLRSSLGNKEWTCLFLIYIHSFSRSVMENDLQMRKNTNTSV